MRCGRRAARAGGGTLGAEVEGVGRSSFVVSVLRSGDSLWNSSMDQISHETDDELSWGEVRAR